MKRSAPALVAFLLACSASDPVAPAAPGTTVETPDAAVSEPDDAATAADVSSPKDAGIDAPQEICSNDGWCASAGAPSLSLGFAAVHVTAAGEPWIASDGAYYRSGTSWAHLELQRPRIADSMKVTNETYGITGVPGGDVWVVGQEGYVARVKPSLSEYKNTGGAPSLVGIWGAAANDVWAVGASGLRYRWSGTAWTGAGTSTAGFRGIMGFGASDVWAYGSSAASTPYIERWNGASWAPASAPPAGGAQGSISGVSSLWGSSPTDIYAIVGETSGFPRAVHFNGATWTTIASVTGRLRSVWGAAANDVWIVGGAGTVYHFDGTAWSAQNSGVRYDLLSVSGSSRTNVWIAGTGGVLHRR